MTASWCLCVVLGGLILSASENASQAEQRCYVFSGRAWGCALSRVDHQHDDEGRDKAIVLYYPESHLNKSIYVSAAQYPNCIYGDLDHIVVSDTDAYCQRILTVIDCFGNV